MRDHPWWATQLKVIDTLRSGNAIELLAPEHSGVTILLIVLHVEHTIIITPTSSISTITIISTNTTTLLSY